MTSMFRSLLIGSALAGAVSMNANAAVIVGILDTSNELALIDTATGDFTPLAPLTMVGTNQPNGLAHDPVNDRFLYWASGRIFSIGYADNDPWNPDSYALSTPTVLWTLDSGTAVNSAAWYNGAYYYFQGDTLYRFAPGNAPTLVADLGLTTFGDIEIANDRIYVSHANRFRAYDWSDLLAGTTTLLYNVQRPRVQLAFGTDRQLYGLDTENGNLYQIDTGTGAFGDPLLTGITVRVTDAAPIPEPAILALMGLGLTGIGLFSARRRRRST